MLERDGEGVMDQQMGRAVVRVLIARMGHNDERRTEFFDEMRQLRDHIVAAIHRATHDLFTLLTRFPHSGHASIDLPGQPRKLLEPDAVRPVLKAAVRRIEIVAQVSTDEQVRDHRYPKAPGYTIAERDPKCCFWHE